MIVDGIARRLGAMFAKRCAPLGLVGLGLVGLGLGGCGNETPSALQAEATGSLEVPLLASVNGHVYRLQAYFYVRSNPFGPPFFNNYFFTGDDPVLSITLPAGDYVSEISSWTLEGQTANGDFRQVQAELASPSSVPFTVFAGAKSTLTYRFSTEGFVVSLGSGGVDITVAVNERPGACVPFGEGCSAGTWCAPSELTGKPLECVEYGSTPVGVACSGPTACVANATCRLAGAGNAICTALCPASEAGTACSDGTLCTLSESGYGVCVAPAVCDGGVCQGGTCGDGIIASDELCDTNGAGSDVLPPGTVADATCSGDCSAIVAASSGECQRSCVEDLVNNGACNGTFAVVGPDSDAVLDCVLGAAWPATDRFPAGSCANGNLLACYCGNTAPSQCLTSLPSALTGPCKNELLQGAGCNLSPPASQSQCLAQVLINPSNATGRAIAYVQCLQDNCPDLCFAQ